MDGSRKLNLEGHKAGIQSLAFSADGKFLATGSEDNTARLWDAVTGQELLTIPGSLNGVFGVAFRPGVSSQLLVASKDGIARVFLLDVDQLLELASFRLTRRLTLEECRKFLHLEQCP